MNRRGNPSTVLIILLLIVTVFLQVKIYKKNQLLDHDLKEFMKYE